MYLFRLALTSALSILLAASVASADAEMSRGYGHHGHHQQSVIGGNGLPSVVPGVGTFVGNVSAVRIKHNGVFLAFDRRPPRNAPIVRTPEVNVQIIEISAGNEDAACSFEAGVCVIRPGR